MRATPFDATRDIGGEGVRVSTDEERHMVRLDSQPNDLPPVLCRSPPNELLQAVSHRAYQHLPAPLRAPDDGVDHQVDVVPFLRVVQVDTLRVFNSVRKSKGAIHPLAEAEGLSGPFSVKRACRVLGSPSSLQNRSSPFCSGCKYQP